MIAYAALAAMQEPGFVAGVRANRDVARRLTADPNAGTFEVPNLALNQVSRDRFGDRVSLLQSVDHFPALFDDP